MSKKITSIKLTNFRAYPGSYSAFELNKGENLLIYGENGSGKSSLYKALNNFFASSIEPSFPFVKNRYCESLDGEVRLSFANFNVTNGQKIAGSDIEYSFSSVSSNHSHPFIQDAALVRGFLDYTDLLKVYLHSEEKPNLFELIVLQLLGNHIPLSSGGNFRFRLKWNQLQKDLNEKAYTRSDKCHKTALSDLPSFEAHLIHTLNTIFSELNRLLSTYFQELNIQLGYELLPLTFHYGRKWEWYTTADLRLDVIKDGVQIIGDYSDVLNEARLSAIAICLYLASLLRNPTQVDFKILYLDDVFIGLDAGNRIPILKIISNEFSAYQILISTYDRHWFELSKRYFEAHSTINWKTAEIYVGSEDIGGLKISKPIIVTGSSNYEQAIFYLHHRVKPDYPAAANYLRKALEELVQEYIPGYELTDSENVQLPEHKLTVLLSRAKNFLIKTGNSCPEVNTIIGLLHTLLHPLSHHEINSPIYKGELIILETAYSKFLQQLNTLNIQNNYKCTHGAFRQC